ncbi:hypothetical protein POM88_030852 [Heracleum sosnowskyi]|uniref:Uncharacterized protein n=1 Tax=Heracleum sosnowskyi TaxID=360622 RepID=A0AAD8MJ66_9APIA|nr:hypothetical protein POM88_030852 [Heracleum sosnowskyi]
MVDSVVNTEIEQPLKSDTVERVLIEDSDIEDEERAEQLQLLNTPPWKRKIDAPVDSLGLAELDNCQERLKPSMEEAPTLELQPLQDKLRYGKVYESNRLYKEKVKDWHERGVVKHSFVLGQRVLRFKSRFRFFPGKRKSRWSEPITVKSTFPHDAVEIFHKFPDEAFKVNGQWLKHDVGNTVNRFRVKLIGPLGIAFRATGVGITWPTFGADSVYPPPDTPPEEGGPADD